MFVGDIDMVGMMTVTPFIVGKDMDITSLVATLCTWKPEADYGNVSQVTVDDRN